MSEQRTIVVTGSASGLGAALLRRLEGEGARVIGVDRRDAEIVANLGTPEGRAQAVAAARQAADGRREGVVSCAGLGPYEEAQPVLRVNFFGAIAVLDGLRDCLAAGSDPAAVAISSVGAAFDAALRTPVIDACHDGDEKRALEAIGDADGTAAYVNSKRALWQAVKRRAPEWGALGVRLNAVAPGWMQTPMLDRLLADEGHATGVKGLAVPLDREASADEIAGSVAFLLGPDSRYVHGHILFADGGAHALIDPH